MNFPIQSINFENVQGSGSVVNVEFRIDSSVVNTTALSGFSNMMNLFRHLIVPNMTPDECASMIAACAARRMEGGV